jgi:fucose 4-O-acetylase-like acetyltransferase
MPMFFYLSGMGSTFFDLEKNNFKRFVLNKIERLYIPMFLAIPVLLIPRLYLS